MLCSAPKTLRALPPDAPAQAPWLKYWPQAPGSDADWLARAGLHQRVDTITRAPDDVAAFPETGPDDAGAGQETT